MNERWRIYVRFEEDPRGRQVLEGFVGLWWCLIAATCLGVGAWMVTR